MTKIIKTMLDIVLVEDNPADVEMTLDALKEYNLASRVKVLRDGEEAINYIFGTGQYKDCGICENPKLILLDLKLPKIDGLELLRRIRSEKRTMMIPVLILTSSFIDKDRIESYQLGVNGYIVKPVDFDNFAQTVAKIGFYRALLNKSPLLYSRVLVSINVTAVHEIPPKRVISTSIIVIENLLSY